VTCLGVGRGDPDAISVFDDVLSKRAVATWSERVPLRIYKRRVALADCADVVVRAYKELLQEETCVHKLAGEERKGGGAVETLLRDATHRLPVVAIWRKDEAGREVHPKEDRR
jgi:hypothetical protein